MPRRDRSGGCEEWLSTPIGEIPWPAACDAVLSGNLAPGAACEIDLQCDGGFCDCGACVAYATEGASCALVRCGPDLTCTNDVCVRALHEGDACTVEFPEAPAGDCPPNLLCVGGVCHAQADFRTAAEGEECYSPRDNTAPRVFCAADLECVFALAGEPGVCVAPVAEGEPCQGAAPGLCVAGTLCHGPSSDMRRMPYVEEGGECFDSGWGDPCAPGLVCGLGTSICRDLADLGEPCDDEYDCHSGYCGDDGTCADSDLRFCR